MGLVEILIAFGAFQALFLSIYLLRKSRSGAYVFLAILLLTESYGLFISLINQTGAILDYPHLIATAFPLFLLKGPLVLYFTKTSMRNGSTQLRAIELLHLIPFLLIFLLLMPFFTSSAVEKLEFVQSSNNQINSYNNAQFWVSIMSFVLLIGYLIKSNLMLRAAESLTNRAKKKLKIIQQIILVFTLFVSAQTILFALSPALNLQVNSIGNFFMIVMTLLIQSLAYNFMGGKDWLAQPNKVKKEGKEHKAISDAIKKKFLEESLFLDDSLTVDKLAKKINCSSRQLSEVINQELEMTFPELVNHYRVQEAIKIMNEERGNEVQMIDIGLESGFNNKVSFYRVFKKSTGLSPSEYYAQLKSEHNSSRIHTTH